MVNTWIFATSALVLAVALARRWRRHRSSDAVSGAADQTVSAEWLSQVRAQRDENW
jgi:hypothetical protein